MYTPIHTPIIGSFAPVTVAGISLHTFLGMSWQILLPYTVVGAVLMVYSQSMLVRGQRQVKRSDALKAAINIGE